METNKENKTQGLEVKIKEFVDSRWFRRTIIAVLAIIVLALVFGAGLGIGYRKANFSYQWGDNYHKMFGGPQGGFMRQMPPAPFRMEDDFISPHGTTGLVIKIDGNNLIVKGNDNVEKTILVSDKTVIRSGRQDIKTADLKVGDLTVTIGQPNDQGQIDANLIRVFPAISKQ